MPIEKKIFMIYATDGTELKVTAVRGAGPTELMHLTIQGAGGVATFNIGYGRDLPDSGDIYIDIRVSDAPGKKPAAGWTTRFAKGANRDEGGS